MLKLGKYERIVLLGIWDDLELWAMKDSAGLHLPYGRERAAFVVRVKDANMHLAALDADAWYGRRPTANERAGLARAYQNLEDYALVERCQFGETGKRTTHLRITRLGAIIARELAGWQLAPSTKRKKV